MTADQPPPGHHNEAGMRATLDRLKAAAEARAASA
jgi:hypothetical protein